MNDQGHKRYAYLPEDLLQQMLEQAPKTAEQLAGNIRLDDAQVDEVRGILVDEGFILQCDEEGDITESVMAADGANIIERKTSSDVILAISVGIDGLSKEISTHWPSEARQYQQWQTALPHHVANPRLSQGVMFLMELTTLAETDREIRIMDGSHLTTILKLNSLLSANDQDAADQPYVEALSGFLRDSYKKVIPDIPDMISHAFSNESIISLTKYTSSREIIDSRLKNFDIKADDKTFMSTLLNENEYTKPVPVGQSEKDKDMWKNIHIKCNLAIEDVSNSELNEQLDDAISALKITDTHESELFFCYYKAVRGAPAHRIEIKRKLAEDEQKLKKSLRSMQKQIVFPEIVEPYPQYLADMIAKNISFGMQAVDQAICNHPTLQDERFFNLVLPYRTN